jgi:hypothetical protein
MSKRMSVAADGTLGSRGGFGLGRIGIENSVTQS